LALYERALIDLWPHLSFDDAPRRILDLGCGQGVVANALASTFERSRLTAIGASASGMQTAQTSKTHVSWIEAASQDWIRQGFEEGPFDLLISHNGWPLDWTLESGLERVIELVAPGGQILLHLDLTLYSALVPGFGLYADLAEAHRRLGHLASGERLEIWRTDLASPVSDVRTLTGLLAAMAGFSDETAPPVEALGKLKSQVSEGRLISRHLFVKLRL
jgi:SAM-dependent methyltransferase